MGRDPMRWLPSSQAILLRSAVMPSRGSLSRRLRRAFRIAVATAPGVVAILLSAARLEAQIKWGTVLERAPNPAIVKSAELRRRIQATGHPWLVRHRKTGMEMVLIPPGEYHRGATPNDRAARPTERPRHRVRITQPFYLGRFEVTNGQFRRWNDKHDSSTFGVYSLDGDRQPAVHISWKSAEASRGHRGSSPPQATTTGCRSYRWRKRLCCRRVRDCSECTRLLGKMMGSDFSPTLMRRSCRTTLGMPMPISLSCSERAS